MPGEHTHSMQDRSIGELRDIEAAGGVDAHLAAIELARRGQGTPEQQAVIDALNGARAELAAADRPTDAFDPSAPGAHELIDARCSLLKAIAMTADATTGHIASLGDHDNPGHSPAVVAANVGATLVMTLMRLESTYLTPEGRPEQVAGGRLPAGQHAVRSGNDAG